jgi:hypothetical protein
MSLVLDADSALPCTRPMLQLLSGLLSIRN